MDILPKMWCTELDICRTERCTELDSGHVLKLTFLVPKLSCTKLGVPNWTCTESVMYRIGPNPCYPVRPCTLCSDPPKP